MSWLAVGSVSFGKDTAETIVGRIAGDPPGGVLVVRVRTTFPGEINPLSYGWLGFRSLPDGTRPLGRARYYASADPESVAFPLSAPGPLSGVLLFDPRRYNREWLELVVTGQRWTLEVEAWLPDGETSPRFAPRGFIEGASVLTVAPYAGDGGLAMGLLSDA